MAVDTDPFPEMEINMVSFSEVDKEKGNKYIWVPKYEVPAKAKPFVFYQLEKHVKNHMASLLS